MSKYLSIKTADIANGIGFRVSVWLSGCRRHCKGCCNPESWDFNAGKEFDEAALRKIAKELSNHWITGAAILGGEPLAPENLEATKNIARLAKDYGKDSWLWTGYMMEDLTNEQLEAVEDVAVIIDGPYIKELSNPYSLKWRGSSNQRIFKNKDGVWIRSREME